jgi:putative transposase
MDFMSDQLASGHRIRVLTIVDLFSRETLALHVGQSIRGYDVVAALDRLLRSRGKPKTIQVDNGSEFTSKAMDQWAYFYQVAFRKKIYHTLDELRTDRDSWPQE